MLPAGAASTLSFSQSRDDSDCMSDLSKDAIPVARLKNLPELAGKNARGRIESVREDEREKSRSKSRDRKPSLQRVAEDDEDGPSRGAYGKNMGRSPSQRSRGSSGSQRGKAARPPYPFPLTQAPCDSSFAYCRP